MIRSGFALLRQFDRLVTTPYSAPRVPLWGEGCLRLRLKWPNDIRFAGTSERSRKALLMMRLGNGSHWLPIALPCGNRRLLDGLSPTF